ncbi:transcriptional regulator, TetR family [Micromonospora nigra]|uniref:Transcriptional regulator, TetR family n=1 Tax=Micromonospora nigra TaxID=145857 RepID=A0A1C6SY90_9ACTN|nr:TetR/AcrR family transcriptional regulator [Micromonospora nigra]SCL34458.1 transcriptional regulator, TetR family [Micromonospora nigra]
MLGETRRYHHGDLRTALVEAGLRLARSGGADALGLRGVTRSVGVTPNAAYRHFADRQALVLAVAVEAQGLLARAMLDRIGVIEPDAEPGEQALERLRAVGLGYIHFALSEPGWFELAILTKDEPGEEAASVRIADAVPPPYQLLLDVLNGLVEAGVLSPERRAHAEWACWSAVHGFADLVTRGPLHGQDRDVIDKLAAHVVDTIIAGIRAGAD